MSYPKESKWSILEGRNQDHVMIVRRNESAKQLMENPKYNYRVGFAVPLLNPNAQGLPTNEEARALNMIEDALISEFEKDESSLLVLVITTSNFREFVFYTKDHEKIRNAALVFRKKFSPYEVQSYILKDEKWDVYKEYI